MIKKIILTLCLISVTAPVFADELINKLNATPLNQFSGTSNTVRAKYPSLYKAKSVVDMQYEDAEKEETDVVSVKEIMRQNPDTRKIAPMTYGNFPQHYDSSNSMMMMQGGMQGMFNQIGY